MSVKATVDRDVLRLCQYRFAGELAQEITYPKLSFGPGPMSLASFLAEPILRTFSTLMHYNTELFDLPSWFAIYSRCVCAGVLAI